MQTQFDTVVYARNITDVDDKIIAAAHESGRTIESVTAEFTAKYREDMAELNALPPTLEPHATHNIDAMIELTRTLIENSDFTKLSPLTYLRAVQDFEPDLVLMDVNMPGIGGIEATRKILQFAPDVRIIAVTAIRRSKENGSSQAPEMMAVPCWSS